MFRNKVFGWAKVEQEKSLAAAPMDIGEVDDSQSALQSHRDWPGQWQVDEATSRMIAPKERAR